jgi:hypothetical protein
MSDADAYLADEQYNPGESAGGRCILCLNKQPRCSHLGQYLSQIR